MDEWFLFHEICDQMENKILSKVNEFQENDSGLEQIGNLSVNINKYRPLRASGFTKYFKKQTYRYVILKITYLNCVFVWGIKVFLTKPFMKIITICIY